MPSLGMRSWRFGLAAFAAIALVGWSASGADPDLRPTATNDGRRQTGDGRSAPNSTVERSTSTVRPRFSASDSTIRPRPLPSSLPASLPQPSTAPAVSQRQNTALPYETDAPGQKVLVVGDSRLITEPERIGAALSESAPDWELVGIFGEGGATASVSPCELHPVAPVDCPSIARVHRHTQLDELLSRTDVDAIVVVTGPNEVSARRGDIPPIWDGVPVEENHITSAWNDALGQIRVCHRLWATQQSLSFVATSPPANEYAAATAAIAAGLNRWLGAAGLADRITLVPWGELADANVLTYWGEVGRPIAPELWFDRAVGDNLHLRAGGPGQVALGQAIGETLSRVSGTACNVR